MKPNYKPYAPAEQQPTPINWAGRGPSHEQLIQIMKDHAAWLIFHESPAPHSLSNTIISGQDFSESNLQWIDFSGSTLINVNFNKACLKGVNFENAKIISCSFENSNLSESNFNNARGNDLCFINSDLTKAVFTNSTIDKANFSNACFHQADLSQSDFSGAQINHADFTNAIMIGVVLHGSKLVGANFSKDTFRATNFSIKTIFSIFIDFLTSILSGRKMTMTPLIGANLRYSDLSEAVLVGVNLKSADLSGANLQHTEVTGVKTSRYSKFYGARIDGCFGSAKFRDFVRHQEFIEELRLTPVGNLLYWVWFILSDCGRCLWIWFVWSVGLILIFAALYHSLGQTSFDTQRLSFSFSTMLYYSGVTFTSLGSGDVLPITQTAAYLVLAEVVTGYIMLGGLISIFATKLTRRG